MKIKNYKGFEIEVFRDKTITGNTLLFYSVFKNKDGFEVDSKQAEEQQYEEYKRLKNKYEK